jgi:hypothetical protein
MAFNYLHRGIAMKPFIAHLHGTQQKNVAIVQIFLATRLLTVTYSAATNDAMSDLTQYISIRGNLSKLAREIGVTPSAIKQWSRIPAERVRQVSKATGIPAHVLRPDIFEPPATQAVPPPGGPTGAEVVEASAPSLSKQINT